MMNILRSRASGDTAGFLLRLTILGALALVPAAARASSPQPVASTVYVERQAREGDGSRRVRLEPASQVRSGDSLLFRVNYRDGAPGSQKMLTSAVPDSVAFIGGGDLVSVDGGRHWGRLADLTVSTPDGGSRRAVPDDVTHVRWVLTARAESAPGLLFRGRVR